MSSQLPYVIPYDPGFLGDGFLVPLPGLSAQARSEALANGRVFDFIHYSLVMHQARKLALYTATNLDGGAKVQIARKKLGAEWLVDERVGYVNQSADWAYGNNTAFDRGHLVRREDVQWGTYQEAWDAARSTFFYANAAPQHMNFNQDEWLELEDYALSFAVKNAYRLSIFAGPVLADDDLTYADVPEDLKYRFRTAMGTVIPTRFWKVIVLRQEAVGGADLAALAFMMDQTALWTAKDGTREDLEVFQVPLSELEQLIGLDFGALRQVDELSQRLRSRAAEPIRVRVTGPESLVLPTDQRRRGRILASALRSERRLGTGHLMAPDRRKQPSCGCAGDDASWKPRVELLEHQVEALVEAVRESTTGSEPKERRTDDAGARGRMTVRARSDRGTPPSDNENDWTRAIVGLDLSEAAKERLTAIHQFNRGSGGRTAADRVRRITTRIVGGDLQDWRDHPSCVAIGSEQQFFCTGVLIGPRTVLTAAHCAADGAVVLPSRVLVGANRVTDPSARIVRVRRGAVHDEYLQNRLTAVPDRDICVLELDEALDPDLFPWAEIATASEVRDAAEAKLVGFGHSNAAGTTGFGVLRSVLSPILAPSDAAAEQLAHVLGFDQATEFVGGMRGLMKDTCRGDSGGPAYVRLNGDDGEVWKVAGLTSRMTNEAKVVCGDGGIYTMVDPFLGWLSENSFSFGSN